MAVGDARPTNPPQGMFFYNTSTGALEFFDGAAWRVVATTVRGDQ